MCFMTAFLATLLGFPFNQAAAIGIIGAADGPTTIFVASRYAQEMLGPLSVAAYCYMSLVPVIQPPIIKLLTTKHERKIRMPFTGETPVSDRALFIFPLMIVMVAGVVAPISVPLIGALMFGKMIGACGISAFPMSGRVIAKMALKEDPTNFIVQDAIGVNVAGQIASVVAGGLVLCMIPMLSK